MYRNIKRTTAAASLAIHERSWGKTGGKLQVTDGFDGHAAMGFETLIKSYAEQRIIKQ
jgi:hypothetical protein